MRWPWQSPPPKSSPPRAYGAGYFADLDLVGVAKEKTEEAIDYERIRRGGEAEKLLAGLSPILKEGFWRLVVRLANTNMTDSERATLAGESRAYIQIQMDLQRDIRLGDETKRKVEELRQQQRDEFMPPLVFPAHGDSAWQGNGQQYAPILKELEQL